MLWLWLQPAPWPVASDQHDAKSKPAAPSRLRRWELAALPCQRRMLPSAELQQPLGSLGRDPVAGAAP